MKWKVLESKELLKSGVFRLRKDRCEMPDGRIMPGYFVMECPDWVQIVPVTKDKKIILVKQYRHAADEVHIEIPGGATSSSYAENPLKAAVREMEEETGYTSSNVQLVCKHRPNPAIQNNYMHLYIAFDCEKTASQQLDPYEDIEVLELTAKEVYDMVFRGEITHSIVVAALFLALPHITGGPIEVP